ncbi:MAG: hypothetical protein SH807_04380 [Blastochloris sp.]|nr:hypothetical protein [Blastochloris sp.]
MRYLAVLSVYFFCVLSLHADRVDKIYSFGSADPREVEEVLKGVLSPEGKIVILRDKAKVLVQDNAGVHELVGLLLTDMAKPRPNIKVEVIFNEDTSNKQRGGDVGFRAGGRDIQVGNRPGLPRNSIDINLMNQTTTTSRSAGQFLVVQSGLSAAIRVVQEVPYVDYFFNYAYGHGYITTQTQWRDIGSQMSVRPTLRGNLIEVVLMPQITALVDGNPMVIDYRDLATTVMVANGQEVSIGGFQGAGDEFNRNFFMGGNRTQTSQSTGFKIRATVFEY